MDAPPPRPGYVSVTTPPCVVCGRQSELDVPIDGLTRYGQGLYVQDAFPDLTLEEREMLITGKHPECFDMMAPEDKE